MFSKSLFKQSCKANGIMWIIITFAVCFMLSCVMLIAGGGSLGETKKSIEDAIISGELESQTQARAVNYYETAHGALTFFDGKFAEETAKAAQSDEFKSIYASSGEAAAKQYAAQTAYKNAVTALGGYVNTIIAEKGYAADSNEAAELTGVVFYTLNPVQENGDYKFDEFYKSYNEPAPRYDLTTVGADTRSEYVQKYAMTNSSVFLAGNMIKDENVQTILNVLSDYGVTKEQFAAFGYTDYAKVKSIANSAVVNYRANLAYRLENIADGETEAGVKAELMQSVSKSLLASLPEEVSSALQEIGSSDLYGALVGSIFFKMAGLLLPIIYVIMTANALVAGQVDSGSMAYILSSSTKRRAVTFTQALFLVSSVAAMFVCTTVTSLVCFAIVDVSTNLTYGKLILINLGAFLVMFAMCGICFFSSCWFNRSKHSMALGGGLNMFFLVATMLGLFGSPVLPSIIRMSALNAFNYVSLISLFDVVSILEGTTAFIWKLCILLVVGVACFAAGSRKFIKKDLPL